MIKKYTISELKETILKQLEIDFQIINTITKDNMGDIRKILVKEYNKYLKTPLCEIGFDWKEMDLWETLPLLQSFFKESIGKKYIFSFDMDDVIVESKNQIHLTENGINLESYSTRDFEEKYAKGYFKGKEDKINLYEFQQFIPSFTWLSKWKLNKEVVNFIKDIRGMWFKVIVITARSDEDSVRSYFSKVGLLQYISYLYCIYSIDDKYKIFLNEVQELNSSMKKFHILKYYAETRKLVGKIIHFDDSDKHWQTIIDANHWQISFVKM